MKKLAAVLFALSLLAGCVKQNPTGPPETSGSGLRSPLDIPAADSLNVSKRGLPGIEAVPPSFPGWNVVSGSRTEIFGPIWDQDWKITFYLPNRYGLPGNRVIAAKNIWGTWLNYNAYALLYSYGQSGSYFRVTYVFGGNRANAFGINMFDPTNWALYYQ